MIDDFVADAAEHDFADRRQSTAADDHQIVLLVLSHLDDSRSREAMQHFHLVEYFFPVEPRKGISGLSFTIEKRTV